MKQDSLEWNNRVQVAINKLIAFAKQHRLGKNEFMTYQEFEGLVGLPQNFARMSDVTPFLRDVCYGIKDSPLTKNDILISSLVAKNTGVPGPGFFALALELGHDPKEVEEESIFAHRQRMRVFEFYQKNES